MIIKEERESGDEYEEDKKILYKDPDFLRFIMNRPHYRVKYNRKRSTIVNYVGPTLTRSVE